MDVGKYVPGVADPLGFPLKTGDVSVPVLLVPSSLSRRIATKADKALMKLSPSAGVSEPAGLLLAAVVSRSSIVVGTAIMLSWMHG